MARALGIAVGASGLRSAFERGTAVAFTPYPAPCVTAGPDLNLLDPHALADAVTRVHVDRLAGAQAEVVIARPATWPVDTVRAVAAALADRDVAHWLISDAAAVYRALTASGRTPAKRSTVVCDCAVTGVTVSVVDSDSNGIRTLTSVRVPHAEFATVARIADIVAWHGELAIEFVVITGIPEHANRLRRALPSALSLPIVIDPEPETSAARGAALVATAVVAALTPTAADLSLSHPDSPIHHAGPPATALPAISLARPPGTSQRQPYRSRRHR